MSHDPDSALDLAQDLPRAAAYGTWAARFSNASPPDGLSEFGAWGHVARWLAQKAAADITIRGAGVASPDLVTNALLTEPSRQLGYPPSIYNAGTWGGPRTPLGLNTRGAHRTLRGMLLWGLNKSPDKYVDSWTVNGQRLALAVAQAIETDPDPAVRLEALKLVMSGSYPVKRWATVILPALDRAQAVLAETPFDLTTRRSLQGLISDARARLLTLLAQQAGLPGLPGGDFLAPPASGVNWKLVAGIGAALALVGVGVAVYRRRRRALPA